MYFSLSVNRCGTQQEKANPALAQILRTPPVDLQASSLVLVDLNLTFLPPRSPEIPSGTGGPEYSGPGPLPKRFRIVSMSLWNCRFLLSHFRPST